MRYTQEMRDFIAANAEGKTTKELTELFNSYFKLELQTTQIRAYKKNHKLISGINTRFKTGQKPFNKGKKKYWTGGEETQFKKGNKPHNYLPVGTERVNSDGYADIKISDPNKWKAKHILIWEEQNGPVPKGHAVIFGDGDKMNLDISNLILISKKKLLIMNKNELIQGNVELTKTGVIIAEVYEKIQEKKKESEVRGCC